MHGVIVPGMTCCVEAAKMSNKVTYLQAVAAWPLLVPPNAPSVAGSHSLSAHGAANLCLGGMLVAWVSCRSGASLIVGLRHHSSYALRTSYRLPTYSPACYLCAPAATAGLSCHPLPALAPSLPCSALPCRARPTPADACHPGARPSKV